MKVVVSTGDYVVAEIDAIIDKPSEPAYAIDKKKTTLWITLRDAKRKSKIFKIAMISDRDVS